MTKTMTILIDDDVFERLATAAATASRTVEKHAAHLLRLAVPSLDWRGHAMLLVFKRLGAKPDAFMQAKSVAFTWQDQNSGAAGDIKASLEQLEQGGMLIQTDGQIALTEAGYRVMSTI